MSARKKKEKKSGGLIINSVSAIVICAVLAIGVSVFFKVSNYEINGASHYTESEIIEASGVKQGTNLIFLNRQAVENSIMENLVYVGLVSVTRKLPNTVVISVHESGTVACVETESGLWLIDSYCRLLEPCTPEMVDSYVKVTGFFAANPKPGQRIDVADEDKPKIDYLEDLLTALGTADMLGKVTGIDMSTSGNAQFDYENCFRVKMGQNEELERKLGLLLSAIETEKKSDQNVKGVFDLSKSKQAYFSPA